MKELEIENSSLIKVLEAFPVCYVLLTTSFKIINASDTYLENVSLKREHIIGKDFFKFFGGPPGSPEAKTMERLRASFEKIRETFVPDQMEVQRYDVPDANDHHKVKHSYWLPINTPVLNADNELQYIIHQVNNVTKLVEIEEQYEDLTNSSAENIKKAITIKNVAEAEKQKLYSLFMQAPAIIAVLRGPQHIFELANPRYMQLVGVNRQLIGKPVREALPEGEGQGFFELLDEVYKSGKPFQGNEVPLKLGLKEDGTLTEVFINFIYQPALDANEKVYGILVHAVEVTEQVQIRRRIEESEDKYRRLFTQMDQGFCIIEMIFDSHENPIDYIFIETNPVFESQTGLKDAAGKTVRSLVPELESRWFERYGNVALTGESVRFTEGSEAMGRWFEVNAFRLGGAESKKVALLFSDITERKKAEESLRLSNIENERLAAERTAIVNQLTEGVVVTDTDGNIVLLNDAAANLHGTSDVNVRLEQHCERYNLFTMDGRRYPYTELPLFKALLKEEIVLNESWWIQRPNGTKVLASGSARPVYANDGAKIGAVLTFRDDTERKIAEQALIESEMRFRTLADEAPVFIFLADEKANVHFWNKTYQEYTGLFGEASLTDSWQKMIHPDDLQSIQHTYLKAAKDRQAYTGEWRLKNKEGHYRWILFQGYPRYTAEGEFIGYMGSGSDIHRSKEAEGILKESEQRLSLALQATRDGIWDWDFINDKAWWDSRYAEITGTNIPEEERSLSSISRFIPADDVQKINDALQAHVEKGKKFEVEFRAIQPSGDIRNVFAKGKAVMDKVGKV
ncbi:MAG TPA: PAS domain S-box protein, partial [Cytophagaceae bacterium]